MSQDFLFKHKNHLITESEVQDVLLRLGVASGDTCFVHSSLMSLGIPSRTHMQAKTLLPTLIGIFEKVLGPEGTLVMPTFSYSYCKNEVFDVRNTRTTVGSLNEYFRKQDNVLRSNHPIFSVAARGPKAQFLCDVNDDSFGEGSFFAHLTEIDGKVLTFGTDMRHATFFHYPEQLFQVSYRYLKEFSGTRLNLDGSSEQTSATFNVRFLNANVDTNLDDDSTTCKYLLQHNLLHVASLGGAPIRCGSSKDFYAATMRLLEDNEFALLRAEPDLEIIRARKK